MNAHLQHRPATAADLQTVVGFPQNADELFFCYPKAVWPLDVELDGRIAGFANFYQWQHGEFCALGNLMVAPWARSRGVAQYLVSVMERIAREHYKVPLMKVSCFNANAGGLLLYSRMGYRAVGIVERRAPDGSRVALVQLEKPL